MTIRAEQPDKTPEVPEVELDELIVEDDTPPVPAPRTLPLEADPADVLDQRRDLDEGPADDARDVPEEER